MGTNVMKRAGWVAEWQAKQVPVKVEEPLFDIIFTGLVSLSVCTNLSIPEMEERANIEAPTGISYGWKLSESKTFATGQTNPCVCEKDPTRKHYLLHC